MRSTIAVLLAISLLVQGCHSYYMLDESAHVDLNRLEKERIAVRLDDGSWVESEPLQHREVVTPSHYVYGKGRFTNRSWLRDSIGTGILPWTALDSIRVLPEGEGAELRCWLRDGTSARFRRGEYTVVTPDGGTGFWVRGERDGDEIHTVLPAVTTSQVKEYKLDIPRTILCVGGVVLVTGVMLAGAALGAAAGSFR